MTPVRFHPKAFEELDTAASYYEKKRPGLGNRRSARAEASGILGETTESNLAMRSILGETSRFSHFPVVSLVISFLNGFDRGCSGENAA